MREEIILKLDSSQNIQVKIDVNKEQRKRRR